MIPGSRPGTCMTSNDAGGRYLVEMLTEYRMPDIETLSDRIIDSSRNAMLSRIRALPKGIYRSDLRIDGYERPVELVAALAISDDGIHIDYQGTSPASSYGINVVLNYTHAYTTFGINCLIGGDIPNNYGSLSTV